MILKQKLIKVINRIEEKVIPECETEKREKSKTVAHIIGELWQGRTGNCG